MAAEGIADGSAAAAESEPAGTGTPAGSTAPDAALTAMTEALPMEPDAADTPDPAPAAAPTSAPTPTTAPAERRAEETAADETADEAAADAVASGTGESGTTIAAPLLAALRLPEAVRPSSREFGYVDAMPLDYAYGGTGVLLEGSVPVRDRFRLLARLGAANGYRELLFGASWYVTPPDADRLTLVLTAGIETGRFELEAGEISTALSDEGGYLGATSRLVVSDRFELQTGVGYSSFFGGDPIAFGGGSYHVTPRLDLVSRVELGDNDSVGIGVRYYY